MNTHPHSPSFVNGRVAFWYRDQPVTVRRPPLDADTSVDVAIVGGGYTGLWSAYYLKRAQPDLRVVVLEAEFAGYGASGRNGGWLRAEPPGQLRRYAKTHGWLAAVALQQEMFRSVDEVIAVARAEGIDAEIVKHGMLHIATNPAQHARLRQLTRDLRRQGWGEDDLVDLSLREVVDRILVPGVRGAQFSPHGARLQPAKLVRGLAAAVERLGVTIHEDTRVEQILPRRAVTGRGTVHAQYVLLAVEGFTAGLPGHHRDLLPMNSSMIVTEPLPPDAWREIGWAGAELLGDVAHSFAYLQRTPDGRIVVGGRGIPYRFGSRTDNDGSTDRRTRHQLHTQLVRYFPAAAQVPIAHTWSGVLGVPRDWTAGVSVDQETGLCRAGGYVGHGVTSTNLAGRTVADLILRRDTPLVRLPWVDRPVRRWEPEPLRWIGARSLYAAYRAADRAEHVGGPRTSRLARAADLISGR